MNFWREQKLSNRIEELAGHRYRGRLPIPSFQFLLDEKGEVGTRPPEAGDWSEIRVGETWKGRDLYAWLAADVQVPADWSGRQVVGRFDFGKTGHGGNFGFESLLFVDGIPYQGVDTNHQEVFFAEDAAGSQLSLRFRLWSGTEGGGKPVTQEHKLQRAELAWLDETVDDLYYTSKAAIRTTEVLDPQSPECSMLLQALDRAYLKLDWSRPGSESFYASAVEASDVLHSELKKLEKHHPVTVWCIGHTHIDVAWRWQLKHTREKAARSFSTVMRLMERYPDYVFLQTQPQLYEYIKQDYPEIYEQIKKRVKEGRWEAEGAMWLESDCNIPSGESLVRQILMGTRFLREEFGVECTYLWLPDVFGYSWALPQILRKSGLDTFMTTKISWSKYNRMPHDTFMWKGIDGTEILTHFITAGPPGAKSYTYNGNIVPNQMKGIWENYKDKDVNRELLHSYGYGDGGGGVNREMLEMRRRLNDMPGLPNIVTGRADEYFKRLQNTVKHSDQYVHTWDGELYLELHRGTYTTQAYVKRMNRKLELLYRETEWLCVMKEAVGAGKSSYPGQQLNEGWKIVLRNQFHDIIPGSSIGEVYEDCRIEYAEAERIVSKVRQQSVDELIVDASPGTVTVWNSSNWERMDEVRILAESGMDEGVWLDSQGNELPAQRSGDEWLVRTPLLPSMGNATITFHSSAESQTQLPASFHTMESGLLTPYYELNWNEYGQLTSIRDLVAEREVLSAGARGNVLQVFEDKPLTHNAWNIAPFYGEKMREVTELTEARIVEIGPMRAVVRFQWNYMDSTIVQDMIVYTHNRRIDFETKVVWNERMQMMKVAFPVHIRATEATYDIQYGNVKRPTHWNTSWDFARFEVVGHQWADVSEHGYGVSLMNDCKYGYDIKDGVMRLTLLRSPTFPDPLADRGDHVFAYSLYPHQGDWRQGDTVREAWALNNPLTYTRGASLSARDGAFSLFKLSADHVMIDAVKKAEDDDRIVLRLHEYMGARGKLTIESDALIASWQESDLMERPMGNIETESVMACNIEPYEIKTFLIDIKPKRG